jgi:uncharacterized protein YlxW (UPF0749 family)
MRLQPPFFAPGTTKTPRPIPAETPEARADRPSGADSWDSADHQDAAESWESADSQHPVDDWNAADTQPATDHPRASSLDQAVESRERWETSPARADRWPDSGAWPADESPRGDHGDRPVEDNPSERWQDRFARATAAADKDAARTAAARAAAAQEEAAARAAAAKNSPTAREAADTNSPTARAAAQDDPAARDRADGGEDTPTVSPDAVRAEGAVPEKVAPWRRLSSAGALIWVLLALLGFTMVVQLRSNDADAGLSTARQEDLVGILSDLEARDQRLQQEINALEESQRQLTSGVAGRQAALAEAGKRADELGLLSGTLPARGPGLKISIDPKGQPIKASAILNAVQELRGAGGEVMEIIGNNGVAVRIVASSYFVDADGGQVIVDGKQLSGPYTVWVIGVPATMQTALQIPGGVVASVSQAGGNVTMEQRTAVEVAAVRQPTSLQYARPVS